MTEKELNNVRDLHKKIRKLENHLATLNRRIEDITPKNDGLPHAATIQSKVEKLALEIVEACRERDELHKQILEATATLVPKICQAVPDPQERTVIMLRYISCLHFRDISFQLGFCVRKVYALHHDALEKFSVAVQSTCS